VDGRLLRRAFLWLGLLEALLCFAAFFFINNGLDIAYLQPLHNQVFSHLPHESQNSLAMTVFYAGVVMAQVGNAFACRTERNRGRYLGWLSNPTLLRGIVIDLVILIGLIYFKPLAELFGNVPIPPIIWIGLVIFPVVIYGMDWMLKMLFRFRERFVHQVINTHISKEEI
jgi:magnesium-transporting ATPase (P-type)